MVQEADVHIYAIGLFTRSRFLNSLTETTGGRMVLASNISDLPAIVRKLSTEIHSHYVLGFSPNAEQRDGKYHKVKVEVTPPAGGPPLRLSWRRGYYASYE